MMVTALVLSCLLIPAATTAATTPDADYFSATVLRDSVAGAHEAPQRTQARLLGDRGRYKYMVIRRDRTGEVEVHARWDDIIIVQDGAGILVYGGNHQGGKEPGPSAPGAGPGELRGGEITDGTVQPLRKGDLMIVPAGIPHQVRVDPDGSITYLVVKTGAAVTPADPGR